jgi:HlyD family secretion protein
LIPVNTTETQNETAGTQAAIVKGESARLPASLPPEPSPPEPSPPGPLPPVIERHLPGRRTVWARWLALVILFGGGIGWFVWQAHRAPAIPAYIVYGNGRLEADPIDIDTKFAGRVAELRVDEGDNVVAGQVLALMDTRDMRQSLSKSEAQVEQAQNVVKEARANLDSATTASVLAEQENARTVTLVKNGFATHELLDQRRQALDAAHLARQAAEHRVTEAEKALKAAQHDAELVRVNIDDNTLVAPRDGRIEYRVANLGEVLPAGGKVFTMLDTAYVYMDVYLPTLQADKVKIGAESRIVLDGYPDRPIPAKVSYLASRAQFTPKMVETQSDRDRMMFRVRVKIDSQRASAHAADVRSGLPGVAYVKTEPSAPWTPALQGRPE